MTRISLAERGAQIMRKREAGIAAPPIECLRNSGLRGTPDKVRLLECLRDEAEGQRRRVPFVARV